MQINPLAPSPRKGEGNNQISSGWYGRSDGMAKIRECGNVSETSFNGISKFHPDLIYSGRLDGLFDNKDFFAFCSA